VGVSPNRRRHSGELLEADLFVSPGGFVREHSHPTQEETFTGISGTLVLEVAGQTLRIAPGDKLVIPPRTPTGSRTRLKRLSCSSKCGPRYTSMTTSARSSASRATGASACRRKACRTRAFRSRW
jgi:Cupin domain